ncbi:MAG: hypothetical protein ACW986_19940 [Promethearchaeota archaeon]
MNWQTGSDFIGSRDSYLRLILNHNGAAGAPALPVPTWGRYGTVLNTIRTVRVISRSGDIVAQIDSANLLNYYRLNYEKDSRWREQQGKSLLGWSGGGAGGPAADGEEFLIPLQLICPLFEHDSLLPSQLCRSLRLELTLEAPAVAFQQVAPTTALTEYSWSGVQLVLDSYTLTSGAVNWLNDRSASNGLVMTYYDYENSHFSQDSGATSYAFEVRKTASMANSVMAIFRDTRAWDLGGVASTELKENSFGSYTPRASDNYQVRVSSLYLPIQPLQGAKQFYQQLNYSLDKLNNNRELGLDLEGFSGEVGTTRGVALNTAILDRFNLEGSGLAINNSSTLVIQGQTTPAPSAGDGPKDKDVDIFLKHTRSLSIFLQNLRRSE